MCNEGDSVVTHWNEGSATILNSLSRRYKSSFVSEPDSDLETLASKAQFHLSTLQKDVFFIYLSSTSPKWIAE
ncbi:hypothetical protein OUZ56_008506 [Daphnia magna]|uniref:Uncharacterized protein n=1 Tax=Daphnia magna TaxID=35525 RepID=A0ABR0AD79_9CRUS|nr:hypothetical protein OUZ56_008506 [Daphnia magna]